MRAPLVSAVTTSTGSWAIVPMGQLANPLNTFWELFYKAPASPAWRLITPPGVADNGGLVVSVAGVGAVTVGFEPSQLLRYSPLALSSDNGASWAPALVPMSLATTPDALATTTGGAGTALALVRGGAERVLLSEGPLLSWHPLSGDRQLASGSDARCGTTGLYAVNLTSTNIALVGTGCRHVGQVGIFAHVGTRWELVGPFLRGSLRGSTTRILRLGSSGVTTTALPGRRGPWRDRPARVVGFRDRVVDLLPRALPRVGSDPAGKRTGSERPAARVRPRAGEASDARGGGGTGSTVASTPCAADRNRVGFHSG